MQLPVLEYSYIYLGLEKTQRNKDICDPLHRSLAQTTPCRINTTFQFRSCNETACGLHEQHGSLEASKPWYSPLTHRQKCRSSDWQPGSP